MPTSSLPRVGRPLLLALLFGSWLPTLAQTTTPPKVGIGTTQPTETLDVDGSLRVRGLSGAGNRLPMILPDGTLGVNANLFNTSPATTSGALTAGGSIGTGAVPTGVAASGSLAYVVSFFGQALDIYDASNPAAPVLRGSVGTNAGPNDVAVSGTRAYVVNQDANTVQVFDVSSPTAPVLLGGVAVSPNPLALAVSGTTVYVVSTFGTLDVVDVANPVAPVVRATLAVGGGARAVAASGTRAYVVNENNNSLLIVDVSNPVAPVALGSAPLGATAIDVEVSGTAVYVPLANATLRIYDGSGAAPLLRGTAPTTNGSLSGVALAGGTAYVVGGGSLEGFNVSTPANPTASGPAVPENGSGVAASGGLVYVIDRNQNTMQVYTVPTPVAPARTVVVDADGALASVPTPAAPTLALNGQDLSISGGNTVTLPAATDAQTLSLNGQDLSISGGNAITLPLSADNLGNHSATTNLGLNGNWLSNAPGTANGLRIDGSGNVGVGVAAPVTQLSNSAANVIGTDGNGVSSQALNWVSATTGYAAGFANTGTATNSNGLAVKVGGSGGVALDVSRGTIAAPGSSLLRVLGSGNVGIGTGTPGAGLHVSTAEKPSVSTTTGVFVSGGASGNPNIELRGYGGVTYLDFVNNLTSDYTSRVISTSSTLAFHAAGDPNPSLLLGPGGTIQVARLANGATRVVTADQFGYLSTAPLLADNLGDHTATQNLNLGANLLVGNGGTSGLAISSTGGVGIGGSAPASAALAVTSTSRGFLPPRMTQPERDGIGSLVAGLTIYNTTTDKLNTWNGTAWTASLAATEQPYQGPTTSFSFVGNTQTYTVPPNVYSITVVARGAQGASGVNGPNTTGPGGLGGQATATLAVTPGEVLIVQVGGAGTTAGNFTSGGGYNGGGNAFNRGGGGGGASDIRRGAATLTDRLLVAGGGGGGAGLPTPNTGGGGGYPAGARGDGSMYGSTYGGGGGTQTAGGTGGQGVGQYAGTLGEGGTGQANQSGGGGGGLYGGGAGALGAGGGGSSGVTATGSSAVAYVSATNAGNGSVTITPGPVYAAPVLNGANIFDARGAWDVNGTAYYYNDGNVGIGTSTPGQKLDVAGSALVSGSVGIGTSAPAAPLHVERSVSGAVTTAALLRNAAGGGGAGVALDFQTYNPGPFGSGARLQAVDDGNASADLTLLTKQPGASFNGLVARLHIESDGEVGIGITDPTQKLDVDGGILARGNSAISNQGAYLQWNRSGNQGETWLLNQQGGGGADAGIRFGEVSTGNVVTEWARFSDNGNLGIGGASPGQKLYVNGAICATVGLNCTSDARYKRNVVPVAGALASVLRLRGVTYFWKQADFPDKQFGPERQLGFIAQEIEPFYPEMVTTDATGYKSVDYSRLTPVLVEAMKEQQAQIEALKAQNATQATELQAVKAQATHTTATLESLADRLRALEAGQGQARK